MTFSFLIQHYLIRIDRVTFFLLSISRSLALFPVWTDSLLSTICKLWYRQNKRRGREKQNIHLHQSNNSKQQTPIIIYYYNNNKMMKLAVLLFATLINIIVAAQPPAIVPIVTLNIIQFESAGCQGGQTTVSVSGACTKTGESTSKNVIPFSNSFRNWYVSLYPSPFFNYYFY